jgi:hypothetical protein
MQVESAGEIVMTIVNEVNGVEKGFNEFGLLTPGGVEVYLLQYVVQFFCLHYGMT